MCKNQWKEHSGQKKQLAQRPWGKCSGLCENHTNVAGV